MDLLLAIIIKHKNRVLGRSIGALPRNIDLSIVFDKKVLDFALKSDTRTFLRSCSEVVFSEIWSITDAHNIKLNDKKLQVLRFLIVKKQH